MYHRSKSVLFDLFYRGVYMSIIVIGGGSSGMMAAITAAKAGSKVTLLEGNKSLGKKLLLTGHGRCNVTNNTHRQEFLTHVYDQPRFLYSALASFDQDDMIRLLEDEGCKLKVEDHHRVFPVSDNSRDILNVLIKLLKRYHVDIKTNTKVVDMIIEDHSVKYIILDNGERMSADHYILCTGGLTMSRIGSTGDGYKFIEKCHTLSPLSPALVPLKATVLDRSCKNLQGTSLKDISLSLVRNNKVIKSMSGDLLFTHFGISGPVILKMSRFVEENDSIYIDLLPDIKDLDKVLVDTLQTHPKQTLRTHLGRLIPDKLSDLLLAYYHLEDKKAAQLNKKDRLQLVHTMKHLPITNIKPLGYDAAMITKGGISLKEIDPKTMRSKIIDNLSFAGEIIDLDGETGGYNLQIAWSTGYLAGKSVNEP